MTHGSLVTWESVQEKLGISKRYRIFVTSVLNLSSEAQEIVLTHNMRERMIRPITQKLRNNPTLQVKALQQVALWQAENEDEEGPTRPIVSSVEMLVDHLLTEQSRKEKELDVSAKQLGPPFHLTDPKKFQRKIRRTLRYFDQLQETDLIFLTQVLASQERYHSTVDDLTNLRERINAILAAVTDRQKSKNT
jgi:ADP-ribose pyrophosphatase YjhB (NUDIX family)